ncbi:MULTISPECIES: OsmC family protein [unclassified Roseovarius]|uniref:OsmC family protein n=1 Tax=unclassified Roseovarius TaxID=2614913 RepID=UPI00273E9B7F|nr:MULTISPECIES: OsmC family protein [unclassified Roseovarius]
MDRDIHARNAQLRAIEVYNKRPQLARACTDGTAEVCDGLGCNYMEGDYKQCIDMPVPIGGTGEAPTPGFFGRAAISGCIAIGIKMMATRENIAVDRIRVRIAQEWDNRGVLAIPGADTIARQTSIVIEFLSHEDDETLNSLVTQALEFDPWFLAYRDGQSVQVSVQVLEGMEQ